MPVRLTLRKRLQLGSKHFRVLYPALKGQPRAFRNFNSDGLTRLDSPCCEDIMDTEAIEITAAQLAVDGHVEQARSRALPAISSPNRLLLPDKQNDASRVRRPKAVDII